MTEEIGKAKANARRDWDPSHPFYGYAHNIKGPHCKEYTYADYLAEMDPPTEETATDDSTSAVEDLVTDTDDAEHKSD